MGTKLQSKRRRCGPVQQVLWHLAASILDVHSFDFSEQYVSIRKSCGRIVQLLLLFFCFVQAQKGANVDAYNMYYCCDSGETLFIGVLHYPESVPKLPFLWQNQKASFWGYSIGLWFREMWSIVLWKMSCVLFLRSMILFPEWKFRFNISTWETLLWHKWQSINFEFEPSIERKFKFLLQI